MFYLNSFREREREKKKKKLFGIDFVNIVSWNFFILWFPYFLHLEYDCSKEFYGDLFAM